MLAVAASRPACKLTQRWRAERIRWVLPPERSLHHIKAITAYDRDRPAIHDTYGSHTYGQLLNASLALAKQLTQAADGRALYGQRIAYLTNNDSMNVVTTWAIWLSGSIAVPLCPSHPTQEQQYFVDDAQAMLVLGTHAYADDVFTIAKNSSTAKHLVVSDRPADMQTPADTVPDTSDITHDMRSLIIYTSGTTGRPKGVVLSHGNINATISDMIHSWEWSDTDVSLHALPLHHVHGLINALHVPLSAGAQCRMLPKFDPLQVWQHLLGRHPSYVADSSGSTHVTVFTSVPTVYAKLLQTVGQLELSVDQICQACSRVRLMMCASSSLPLPLLQQWQRWTGHVLKERYGMSEVLTVISNPLYGRRKAAAPVMNRWKELTTHTLLERYGMSEVLMAITNPLHGRRVTGTVGQPFPSVQTRIVHYDQNDSTSADKDLDGGELHIKGPTVFKEYWNRPEATREAFTSDGWFKTGDTVSIDSDGYYRILGRSSVDIIKCGGYKISALDIESKILQHPSILECAVLGVPDDVYGQVVAALVVSRHSAGEHGPPSVDDLKAWCSELMPAYHVPRLVRFVDSIPRNAMGRWCDLPSSSVRQQLHSVTGQRSGRQQADQFSSHC